MNCYDENERNIVYMVTGEIVSDIPEAPLWRLFAEFKLVMCVFVVGVWL